MSLWPVFFAIVIFVGSHVFLSGTRLRAAIAGAIGEAAFLILYSLISLVTLFWVVQAYRAAPQVELWYLGVNARWVALVLVALGTFLAVAGATSRNPMSIIDARDPDGAVRAVFDRPGILSVTRHPLLWGVGLWAVAHLLVNGHGAAAILFGGLLVLALVGSSSQDHKKAESLGDDWPRFAAETSWLPFGAIATGATSLDWVGIGWIRVLASVVVFAVLIGFHGMVIGVSPLP